MKIIISPAKSLDENSKVPTDIYSQAPFLEEASELNSVLKQKTPQQLSALMNISEKLGELNWKRNQIWALPFTSENAKQALFLFKGDVYVGIDAYSLSDKKIDYLQQNLRILSGQYGLLKPLDLMQPYRLEMGTKLSIKKHQNLYQFWGDKITDVLNSELKNNEVLVNLASNEYFKSVNKKRLNATIITPVFKDYKNGALKTIAFYAKKARGLMVRYMADKNIQDIENIKAFNYDGYGFDSKLSSDKEWVFTR